MSGREIAHIPKEIIWSVVTAVDETNRKTCCRHMHTHTTRTQIMHAVGMIPPTPLTRSVAEVFLGATLQLSVQTKNYKI